MPLSKSFGSALPRSKGASRENFFVSAAAKRNVRLKTEARLVLDASALLAYLQRERGYERVQQALAQGAAMSTVNLAEVYAKAAERAISIRELAERLQVLGLNGVAFTEEDARISAALHPDTRALGLSLGDRACLALGSRLRVPVLTTDRTWKRVRSARVELLR